MYNSKISSRNASNYAFWIKTRRVSEGYDVGITLELIPENAFGVSIFPDCSSVERWSDLFPIYISSR